MNQILGKHSRLTLSSSWKPKEFTGGTELKSGGPSLEERIQNSFIELLPRASGTTSLLA
jgi:hypothetical protein